MPDHNTAAAAWCANTKHRHVVQLGPEKNNGIYEAKYKGVEMAIKLAKRITNPTTRRISIVLDNQSMVADLASHKFSPSSLHSKATIFSVSHFLSLALPLVRITVRWCPGDRGVEGNKVVDKLGNRAAKDKLPKSHIDDTNLAAFRAAIKDWTKQSQSLNEAAKKQLGHAAMQTRHLKAISKLPKYAVATITQMRCGHIPLYSYLHQISLRPDPECACTLGTETTEHFLLLCPLHDEQRKTLRSNLKGMDIDLDMKILNNPKEYSAIASFNESTWRFSNRWDWAELVKKQPLKERQDKINNKPHTSSHCVRHHSSLHHYFNTTPPG